MAPLGRRRFLALTAAGASAALAGCSDGSVDEIEANIEESITHLETAEDHLDEGGSQVNDEEFQACLGFVEDTREELDAAGRKTDEALELAREGDHEDHVTALERTREYITIFDQVVDELEKTCEAGQEGDVEAADQHWDTVQDLDEQRKDKREQVSDAIDDL